MQTEVIHFKCNHDSTNEVQSFICISFWYFSYMMFFSSEIETIVKFEMNGKENRLKFVYDRCPEHESIYCDWYQRKNHFDSAFQTRFWAHNLLIFNSNIEFWQSLSASIVLWKFHIMAQSSMINVKGDSKLPELGKPWYLFVELSDRIWTWVKSEEP